MRLALCLALACLVPASSAAARDCGTDVRVFEEHSRWYACGPASARPTLLWVDNAVSGAIRIFGRSGDKVLLEGSFLSEGGEEPVVGWFDVRTSRARVEQLATGGKVLDIVVAADGGIGVAAGARVGYLAPGADRERILSTYAQGSLAFGPGTLTWGDRSVPLTGEAVTCTSGTTLLERDGARLFEVYANGRDVLVACERGTARELAASDRPWTLRAVAGSTFLVGANGVGVLGGGFLLAPGYVHAIADGAFAVDGLIARVTATGWERVATATADSLTVADGRVTWPTGSAPLGAETPVDCHSGTTRLQRRGLRVFETGRADKALLACRGGALIPLLAPIGRPRWTVSALGRSGLLVHARGAETHDVIRFDPPRRGAIYGPVGTIRDVEFAPDGRVAIATQHGRRWRIRALPLAGPGELGEERLLAEPRDGVRSLRFDGNDVTWRNRAGKLRRAELR